MFDFIKKALMGSITPPAAARVLEKPEDLEIGDIITFRFLPQATLSGKNFQVTAIHTLDFKQGEFTHFTLQGENSQPIDLTWHENDGEILLAIRQKIKRETVDTLFGLEAFSAIFEEGNFIDLARQGTVAGLEGWLADNYHKSIDCRKGYLHAGDYRGRELLRFEDESEGLDYYLLVDKTEAFGVEVEVYNDGESEAYITVYCPCSIIESMWPGK